MKYNNAIELCSESVGAEMMNMTRGCFWPESQTPNTIANPASLY